LGSNGDATFHGLCAPMTFVGTQLSITVTLCGFTGVRRPRRSRLALVHSTTCLRISHQAGPQGSSTTTRGRHGPGIHLGGREAWDGRGVKGWRLRIGFRGPAGFASRAGAFAARDAGWFLPGGSGEQAKQETKEFRERLHPCFQGYTGWSGRCTIAELRKGSSSKGQPVDLGIRRAAKDKCGGIGA
jgi:hypothetical protein